MNCHLKDVCIYIEVNGDESSIKLTVLFVKSSLITKGMLRYKRQWQYLSLAQH